MEVSTLLELFDGICEVFNTVLLSLVSSFSAVSVNKVCIYLVSSIKITRKKNQQYPKQNKPEPERFKTSPTPPDQARVTEKITNAPNLRRVTTAGGCGRAIKA